MLKIKMAAVVLFVACALSAVAASSASANWFVEGSELAKGATVALATTGQVEESTVLNVPSLGVRVTCTGGTAEILKATKPFIQGPNYLGAESFTFEGCSELTPSTCTVATTTETEPVVASVEPGTAPLDKLAFAPKAGKLLATILFKGSCSVAGEQPVSGKLNIDAPLLQSEATEQAIEPLGTTENNSLEFAKAKAYLTGGESFLSLASGKAFAFAQGPAGLRPNPAGFNFGNVVVKKLSAAQKIIYTALREVKILKAEMEGKEEVIFKKVKENCVGKTLKVNETCEIEVDFFPEHKVRYATYLEVEYEVLPGGEKRINGVLLLGKGE